ncbi:MAG: hypothetical protein NC548_38090 [Lachnospiraceae bacterium]|nr:hypothetical protein [Lachnospiraceae bacterium]
MEKRELHLKKLQELYKMMSDLAEKNIFLYGPVKKDVGKIMMRAFRSRADWVSGVPDWANRPIKWEIDSPKRQAELYLAAVGGALDCAELGAKEKQKELF